MTLRLANRQTNNKSNQIESNIEMKKKCHRRCEEGREEAWHAQKVGVNEIDVKMKASNVLFKIPAGYACKDVQKKAKLCGVQGREIPRN